MSKPFDLVCGQLRAISCNFRPRDLKFARENRGFFRP